LLFLPVVVARCPLMFVQPFVPVRAEKGPSTHRPWAEGGQRAWSTSRTCKRRSHNLCTRLTSPNEQPKQPLKQPTCGNHSENRC
jgi:hypothetical protein